jgi:colanic acid biosynthesis glycosyl transferase WcaI
MRITLLNQFFWPDTVATAQHLSDLAQGLAKIHEVTVICSGAGERRQEPAGALGASIRIVRTRGIRFSHRGPARIAS